MAGPIFVPDESCRLVEAGSLHFNDAAWLDTSGMRLVHPDMPQQVAEALGVRSLRCWTGGGGGG